jgi:hypothetical protein
MFKGFEMLQVMSNRLHEIGRSYEWITDEPEVESLILLRATIVAQRIDRF